MKKYIFLAVLSLIPALGFSQTAVDQDVDQELNQLYSQQGGAQVPTAEVRPAANASAQPIYIVNQAPVSGAQQQVQKQPLTVVQDSPLTESRADQMRKMRQDTELATETKIVEKLEQSRMEDEKRRAEVLFGGKFNSLQNGAPAEAAPAAPAPVPVQVITASQENTRDIVREEITAALKTEEEAVVTPVEQRYFSGLIGIAEVPDAVNVRGNYSLGATFGTKFDNTYAVEGSFIASNFTMNPVSAYSTGFMSPDMEVNAYSGVLALKYSFLSGIVKPVLGGLVQYTYRTYNWSNRNMYNSPYMGGSGNDTATNSHAIDLGVIVGADIDFNQKFSLGLDYRYLFNLSSRRNNNSMAYQPYYGTPLESLNSYLISLSARVNF